MSKNNANSKVPVLLFALTIFVSAFLLFQVQPLIGKYILPWFGGAPSVWTTCMLFFQVALFGGYAYAHYLIRLSPWKQAIIHVGLLLLAAVSLPISPDPIWQPTGGEEPVLRITLLLLTSVGLPYFVLASTGPLLQQWFAQTQANEEGKASPYRLYALSNVGSLLALLSYPFLFEPALSTGQQANYWSYGFGAFALFCGACAVLSAKWAAASEVTSNETVDSNATAPAFDTRILWFGLSMTASVMLLATTNQVCMDVASVPFLWVLPLAIYLLTFILCFDGDNWYQRRVFSWALGISAACTSIIMLSGAEAPLLVQVTIYFSALFFFCMVCHGELVKLKPDPKFLTGFYLTIAAGGAAGGLFVGLLAPAVFPSYFEMHFGILACVVLALWLYYRDPSSILGKGKNPAGWIMVAFGVMWLCVQLGTHAMGTVRNASDVSRSFYGVLRILEFNPDDPDARQVAMVHGRITHGLQFVSHEKKMEPTAYFHRGSGVGQAIKSLRAAKRANGETPNLRVGVIGLGVGTLAAYGEEGDFFRFYEINPDVIELAKRHFTFLRDSKAEVELVLGDARLSLQQETDAPFDLLIVDAFSGDAIPTHLLTSEAMEVYLPRMSDNGVLVIHFSNTHLDLEPVIHGLAQGSELHGIAIKTKEVPEMAARPAHWAVLMKNQDWFEAAFADGDVLGQPLEGEPLFWTDDRCNLFDILR